MNLTHFLPRPVGVSAVAASIAASAALILNGGCQTQEYRPGSGIIGPPSQSSVGGYQSGLSAVNQMPLIEGPFDEVWVIARSHPSAPQAPGVGDPRALPGTGSLLAIDDDSFQRSSSPNGTWPSGAPPVSWANDSGRAFPLERTSVRADISGPIATVRVNQRFQNPYQEKIEAVYVFPLPHDAAVNDFVLSIGDRRIRGVIREREEAQRIYQDARSAGLVASLLEQERSNIFMERVANLEPGRAVDVTLTYVNSLAYENDGWEWRFPMVVAPRFNPPGSTAPITGLAYLRDGERSGADIEIEVALDAGTRIRRFSSPSHGLETVESHESTALLRLSRGDRIPNRDFILRYETGGSAPSHSFVTDGSSSNGAMLLTILPPVGVRDMSRVPLEVVFVLDTSGSMSGRPIAQLIDAVDAGLAGLRPDDSFQIITFNSAAAVWGNALVPADSRAVSDARRYAARITAGGGTMMLEGLRAALALPHQSGRVRTLVFITDAQLSNEDDILRELHSAQGRDRVFALGVGSNVNWALLDAMARVGNGAVAALALDESAGPCMSRFLDRISRPAIHSMQLTFEGGDAREIVPSRLPDLAPGTPVTIAARYGSTPPTRAILTGWVDNRPVRVTMDLARTQRTNDGVRSIWARQRIAELSREATWGNASACRSAIRELALANNLVSPFTSFVAVDATRSTGGSSGTTVVQPAHMPHGVPSTGSLRDD